MNVFTTENDQELGELAHKMLTPFSQLGENPVVPILGETGKAY